MKYIKYNLTERLLNYFKESKSLNKLQQLLKNDVSDIVYNGNIGSSLAIDISHFLKNSNKTNLFIFKDKEEASYS